MDWLTFLSKVLEALAWPTTVLVVIFLVRKELPSIARSLRRFKYKDVEFEFGESAKVVADEVKEALPPSEEVPIFPAQSQMDARARLDVIADLAPRAAILESWLLVEAAAVDVIRKKKIMNEPRRYPPPQRLRESLERAEALNNRQLYVFESLRRLRNEAVHVADAEFTKEAVNNYIEAALLMATHLENIADAS